MNSTGRSAGVSDSAVCSVIIIGWPHEERRPSKCTIRAPSTNICTSMLGQVSVTMGGKTVVRRAGDQWTEPKSMPMALTNTGNVPYVDKTFEIYYE